MALFTIFAPKHSANIGSGANCVIPWVPEIFHAQFPVSVRSSLVSSAFRTSFGRRRRNPLVPRVGQGCRRFTGMPVPTINVPPHLIIYFKLAIYFHLKFGNSFGIEQGSKSKHLPVTQKD